MAHIQREIRRTIDGLELKLGSLADAAGQPYRNLEGALQQTMSELEDLCHEKDVIDPQIADPRKPRRFEEARLLDLSQALALSEALVEFSESLNRLYHSAEGAPRQALAAAIADLYVNVLRPLWAAFPELLPPQMSHRVPGQ